ncbi:MAG: dTDP-4-dehydrorhamnose reductase [Burkholderiales bacterium]
MKILLIGATGQLGGDLVRNNPGHDIVAPARDVLDLSRPQDFAGVLADLNPNLVINCAAFHNVPKCETDPAEAFAINHTAMRDLARCCESRAIRLVTFSTDMVFGGERNTPWSETDTPCPLQTYGISRLAGEFAVLSVSPARATIIRTCGLYGRSGAKSKGGNFVDGRIADALAGKRIQMASEQIIAPTSTDDLSKAVFSLIAHKSFSAGIYHLVNEGSCSWYEFTLEIVKYANPAAEVVPVDLGGITGGMRRPLYSVLGNNKARALGVAMRPWKDALADYLRGKYPQRISVN